MGIEMGSAGGNKWWIAMVCGLRTPGYGRKRERDIVWAWSLISELISTYQSVLYYILSFSFGFAL